MTAAAFVFELGGNATFAILALAIAWAIAKRNFDPRVDELAKVVDRYGTGQRLNAEEHIRHLAEISDRLDRVTAVVEKRSP